MTNIELQKILGERIRATLKVDQLTDEARKIEMEKSDMVSRLAKQMINNADVILRTDKLVSEGKLQQSNIQKIMDNV